MSEGFTARPLHALNDVQLQQIQSTSFGKESKRRHWFRPQVFEFWRQQLLTPAADESFSIWEKETPKAICFIGHADGKLSFGSRPATLFFAPEDLTSVSLHQFCVQNINSLAEKIQAHTLSLAYTPYFLSSFNSSLRKIYTQINGIIDLTRPEAEIRSGTRKSFRSLINWGAKNLKVEVWTSENIHSEIYASHKQFHFEVAGRKTRNDETWNIHYRMIQENMAYLVTAHLDSKLVSTALVLHGNEYAYYDTGVNDLSIFEKNIPVGHFTVYAALLHEKKIGLKEFDVGQLNDDETAKQKAIGLFKRGFTSFHYIENILQISFTKDSEGPAETAANS